MFLSNPDIHNHVYFIAFLALEGKEMTVDVEPTYTIAKIKELLEEKEGIPVRLNYIFITH